jgi:hypothetical protein
MTEIGLFCPPPNVNVSASVATHARSRIINIVCEMNSRQRVKSTNGSSHAVDGSSCVSVRDIENLLRKWKFRYFGCGVAGAVGDCVFH